MVPEERWVGVEHVAAYLRVAKESIYRWVESKGFPAHRVGCLLRFNLVRGGRLGDHQRRG
jgi:excisionase family DNA binding protein